MSNQLFLIFQGQRNIPFKELKESFMAFTCDRIIEAVKTEPDERRSWILPHFESAPLLDEEIRYSCWGKINTITQIEISSPESMAEQLEFIHSFPVRDRIVLYSADYLYSSARDYADMPGLVTIVRPTAVEQALDEIENRKGGFKRNYK